MIIFPILLSLIALLVIWQSIAWLLLPKERRAHWHTSLKVIFLIVISSILSYGWRSTLERESAFLALLPQYPEATIDIIRTPIFSATGYWTFETPSAPDRVFTWYRSRAKHAGWTIDSEGNISAGGVFVVTTRERVNIFVVLEPMDGKTRIIYSTEGSVARMKASPRP